MKLHTIGLYLPTRAKKAISCTTFYLNLFHKMATRAHQTIQRLDQVIFAYSLQCCITLHRSIKNAPKIYCNSRHIDTCKDTVHDTHWFEAVNKLQY